MAKIKPVIIIVVTILANATTLLAQDSQSRTQPEQTISQGAEKTLFERRAEKVERDPSFMRRVRTPPAEMNAVKWMTGTWEVIWKAYATPVTKERSSTMTIESKFTMNGRWLFVPLIGSAGSEEDFYLTYDSFRKQWKLGYVNSVGTFSVMESNGWGADKLMFTGAPFSHAGEMLEERSIWTKKSDNEWLMVNEEKLPSGKYVPVDEYKFVRK